MGSKVLCSHIVVCSKVYHLLLRNSCSITVICISMWKKQCNFSSDLLHYTIWIKVFTTQCISCFWMSLNMTRSLRRRVLFKIHCGHWQVLWPKDGETGKQEDSLISMVTPQWCAGARATQMHSNASQARKAFSRECEVVHMALSTKGAHAR